MDDEQIVKDLIKRIKNMTPEEVYENDIKVAKAHPEIFISITTVIKAVLNELEDQKDKIENRLYNIEECLLENQKDKIEDRLYNIEECLRALQALLGKNFQGRYLP